MMDSDLSNAVASGGLSSMTVAAFVVGAFVVMALLIWDRARIAERLRKIETKILRMEKIICLFEMQESRRLVMELNAKSSLRIDPRITPEEKGIVDIEPCISPISTPVTAAGHLEGGKTSKLTDSRRPVPSRKPARQR
jgi:hypothetical protein